MRQGLVVRRLGDDDRQAFADHLMALDDAGLRCRFMGNCSPVSRKAYAQTIDMRTVLVSGVFGDGCLLGVSEVHPTGADCAEIALSVNADCRGQGLGSLLMDDAFHQARLHGLLRLEARCLPLNGAMRVLMSRRKADTRLLDMDEMVSKVVLAA